MRDLKTLYQLLLDEFDSTCFYGICAKISNININNDEWTILYKDFESRKIKWTSRFYWNSSFRGQEGYWWTLDKKGNKQRKLYLQHIINSL